jgi:(1->4)-alpha-D-glucan 1-alpha-D-glucosylmutase
LLVEIEGRMADRRALVVDLRRSFASGTIKLFVTHVLLQLRRALPDLFRRGEYEPASVSTDRAFCFSRSWGDDCVVVCVGRLVASLSQNGTTWPIGEAWARETVEVPRAGVYREVFTDRVVQAEQRLDLADVFAELPVAVLVRERGAKP